MERLNTYQGKEQRSLVQFISGLLLLLFTYTLFSKLADYSLFESHVRAIPYIGWFPCLAKIILFAEVATVILLLYEPLQIWGLYAATTLLITFTVYIAIMLVFASKLPCSCGGVLSQMSWGQHLVFNLFFLALSLLGIRLSLSKNKQMCREAHP